MFEGSRDAHCQASVARMRFSEKQEAASLLSILAAAPAEGHSPQPPSASVHHARGVVVPSKSGLEEPLSP